MFKTCGDIDDIKRLGQFLKLSLKKRLKKINLINPEIIWLKPKSQIKTWNFIILR